MAKLLNKLTLIPGAEDGFDFSAVYQMVPHGQTRDVIIETTNPSTVTFSRQNVALAGNVRLFPSKQPVPGSSAERFSNTLELPKNSKLLVGIKGIAPGFTFLEASDNTDEPSFKVELAISVKAPIQVKFAFVFLSDLIRGDVRARFDPAPILAKVKTIFKDQANVDLMNIDDAATKRDVHVLADLGDPLNLDDDSLREKAEDGIKAKFPNLFTETDFVAPILWKVRGKHKKDKLLGGNVKTAGKLNAVYLSLEPDTVAGRIHTMAHEFGHAMGLPHALENQLMFPTLIESTRLLAGHIEQIHGRGPIFPGEPD